MVKRNTILGVFISALVLGGCTLTAKPQPWADSADLSTGSPEVTVTGNLIKAEVGYILESSDGTGNIALDVRMVKPESFEGKTVTIKGQYSGTTLFVDSIK